MSDNTYDLETKLHEKNFICKELESNLETLKQHMFIQSIFQENAIKYINLLHNTEIEKKIGNHFLWHHS
jgi:predicted RNase H-like nuclease (RuvC/YqgF family)